MRVPDITLTAGNAAQFAHINNLTEPTQSTTSTGAAAYSTLGNELNKNNDWTRRQCQTTTTGRFNFLPTDQYSNSSAAYTSSADEFVQRALSSSIAVPYEYNTPTLAGAHGYGDYYQGNSQTQQNYLENFGSNSNSAYKGFQEVYVNRAAIALDDYEKANYGRGEEEEYETHGVGASSSARLDDYQYAHYDMKLDLGANTHRELNSNHQEEFINNVGTEEYARVGNPDPEYDYNDQSMLDLGNDIEQKSAEEQHNDELDEYLTSPTSSSVSLTAPHRSYFPRGIVNPNYPGFQHLAHTLSEHFIGCTPTDSYDSDMSECEMELSGDSCDDLSNDEQQSELNMKINIYNNNSNSNDSHKRESEERLESAELSNSAQQQHVESYTDANSNSAINSNNETSEDQQQQQQHQLQQQHNKLGALIANELHENLRQLLTLNVPDNYTDAYIINSADQFPFRYDQKCRLVAQIDGETSPPPVYGTTPDILLKNSNVRQEQQSKSKENRPDLLRGVSPQPLRKHVETGRIEVPRYESIVGSKQETGLKRNSLAVNAINSTATTPVRSSDLVRDDGVGFGITPVDIIGDFEQEVEREFGLLVSGYRRLVEATNDDTNENENEVGEPQAIGKVSDAMLSSAKDLIDSDKYVNALQQNKEVASVKVETKTASAVNMMDFMEDNNAVDWSYGRCGDSEEMHSSQARGESDDHKVEDITDVSTVSNTNSAQIRPKYQKPSYDERQLPPVAIEYKRCQQSIRSARKSPGLMNHEKSEKATKAAGGSKIARNHTKGNLANRFFNSRRTNVGCSVGSRLNDKSADSTASRRREEAEIHQYQELISNKEQISSNSRYAKMSGWSQHVKSTVKNHGGKYANSELASPSALELFDAYKIGGDFDKETLQKHLKLAKEIEKKRRSDREEIRRRLAMGADENSQQSNERAVWKAGIQSRAANAQLGRLNDPASDTESHSSDSETCPKLSKTKVNTDNASALNVTLADKPTYPYAGNGRGAPLSSHGATSQSTNMKAQQAPQNLETTLAVAISSEDMECDFFTKQAKLQIEARMALAQAKEMAHMQMEIERQHRRTSPITDIIRVSLRKVGVQMSEDKRRLSRLMLTDMNIAQLQVLVNSLHTHIEDLNESLVHNLMERDDLHVSQDSMLVDIEELTRYIGANEHLAQRYKNPNLYNHK